MVFASLLIGAMIPYAFSAMTMKSVGEAALGNILKIIKNLTKFHKKKLFNKFSFSKIYYIFI
jgi:Na+/H+-translocating membrane pyrophosphatase